MKKSLSATFAPISFGPSHQKLASQHPFFDWMRAFLKEKAKTFLKFLEFLQSASSVQWASCTLKPRRKEAHAYLSKTFHGRLELPEKYFGRIHVKVWKYIWKMRTCYYVSLHLSKITLTLLFLQGIPGWSNLINYSCAISNLYQNKNVPPIFIIFSKFGWHH